MISGGGGRIINISSILSQSALPQLSIYASSKGGMDAFTRSIAVEFMIEILRVIQFCPVFVRLLIFQILKK